MLRTARAWLLIGCAVVPAHGMAQPNGEARTAVLALRELDAKGAVVLLRTMVGARQIEIVDERTIRMTDSAERLQLAERVVDLAERPNGVEDARRYEVADGSVIASVRLRRASVNEIGMALRTRIGISRISMYNDLATVLVRDTRAQVDAAMEIVRELESGPSGAAAPEPDADSVAKVGFLVVGATGGYEDALAIAAEVAKRSGIALNLRGLVHDAEHGLTWPKLRCDEDPSYPFPCYLPRGRFDDGAYVSIERSEAFDSLPPGQFAVIAASGAPNSPELASALAKLRSAYPEAYIDEERVWLGCIH